MRVKDAQEALHTSSKATRQAEGLWLGPIVSESYLQANDAASAAGNLWQAGIVAALQGNGHGVRAIAGIPHAAWPRGRLFAPADVGMADDASFQAEVIGYLNLPIVKLFRQRALLRRLLRGDLRRGTIPSVAFSYNAGFPEAATGRWLQTEFGVPWVCVVADYPESSDPRVPVVRRAALDLYSRLQQQWIGTAAGRVYLSWGLYERDTQRPKFHLEGGVAAVRGSTNGMARSKQIVMYTGNLSAYAGVELLLAAFARVREPQCELWICGRGNLENAVVAAATVDPRIRFFGLVSRARLDDLMGRAHVFVNPRPSSVPENRANFPSKLLEYLSWCRPVVSTMTPGIAPRYRSVLNTVEDETVDGLAVAISAALDRTAGEIESEVERIRAFVTENLLWSVQARRLWEWVEAECGVPARR